MKKILLCIMAFTITSAFVYSQGIRFGIDPGLALSRGSYTPDEGIDRRFFAGFDGGVLIEFSITPGFMIQPEVNYSMTGVELNDGSYENTLKLSYITIPVLAKINMGKFNFLAGPSIGKLVAARNDPSSGDGSTEAKDYFKCTDFILVLGTEYKFGKSMFLGVRYNLGLLQIAQEGKGFEMKTRSIGFRIGYIFGAGKK